MPEVVWFQSLLILLHPPGPDPELPHGTAIPETAAFVAPMAKAGAVPPCPQALLPSRRPSGRINPSGSQVLATSPMERATRRTPPVPAGGSHQPEQVLDPRERVAPGLDRPSPTGHPSRVQGLELKDEVAVVTGPGGTEQGCTLGDIKERLARPHGRGK